MPPEIVHRLSPEEEELAAKRFAEQEAQRERAEAERRASEAPDRDKIAAYLSAVLAVPAPNCSTPGGKRLASKAVAAIKQAAQSI